MPLKKNASVSHKRALSPAALLALEKRRLARAKQTVRGFSLAEQSEILRKSRELRDFFIKASPAERKKFFTFKNRVLISQAEEIMRLQGKTHLGNGRK